MVLSALILKFKSLGNNIFLPMIRITRAELQKKLIGSKTEKVIHKFPVNESKEN